MATLHHFEHLASTQDKAFEVLEREPRGVHVVTCDRQSAGRGREGRAWTHEEGKSLAFSYAFCSASPRVEGLSLVVGLSLLRAMGLPGMRLKWPNDLMLEDQKRGGILVEMKSHGSRCDIVIGVGLNWEDLKDYRGLGMRVPLETLVNEMERDLAIFFEKGFSFFKDVYEKFLWRKDHRVLTTLRGEKVWVRVLGVSPYGALTVDVNGSTEEISSGEILLQDRQ